MRRGLRRRLLRLAALAAALACASPEEQFRDRVSRGEQLVEEGRVKEAILEYRAALKLSADNAELYQRLGDLLSAAGEQGEATFHYREAHRLEPDRVEAAMREAQLLFFEDAERSETLIAEALQRHPDAPIVHRTHSGLALVRSDTARALEAAQRTIELEPDEPRNWVQLGTVHLGRIREQQLRKRQPEPEMFQAALDAFGRADETADGHVGARIDRARVYAAWEGHEDDAAEAYRSALALSAERDEPLHVLAAAYAADEFARITGRTELRRAALTQIISVAPARLEAWEQLANLAAQAGGTEAADAILLQLVEARPDDVSAHRLYANHLLQHQGRAEAIAYLEGVIEDGVDSPQLHDSLLRMRLQRLQLGPARATLADMADRFPDHPLTLTASARIALAEMRVDDAVLLLERVVEDHPLSEAWRLLAVAERRRGNDARALEAAERSLETATSFARDTIRLKAELHGERGEWVEALRALGEIERAGRELNAEERVLLATGLYRTGQRAAGRQVLENLLASPEPPDAAAVEFARREGQGSQEAARAHLEAALERGSESYDVIASLTILDLGLQRGDEALARLDRAIESGILGPRLLLLRANLLLAGSQDLDRAEADVLRAFEAAPEMPGAADLLFAIYAAQGKLEEARRSFEEAESVGVLHAGARLLLARLYENAGEEDRAVEMYGKVVEDSPDLGSAKLGLARLLAEQGRDLDRALRLANEAQRSMGDSVETVHAVGYVYLRKGLNEAAHEKFQRAFQLGAGQPTQMNPALYYHLGLSLQGLDRSEDAARAFEKALALDANFPNAEDARQQLESTRASGGEAASSS
jgi:tetratricopeptide (TPR) repeat protein